MKLSEFISTSYGKSSALARAVGVTPAAVCQWASGAKRPDIENCKRIEFATSGDVRCEDLRPDLNWDYIRAMKAA